MKILVVQASCVANISDRTDEEVISIISRRQIRSVRNIGVDVHIGIIRSRFSPVKLVQDYIRLRRYIKDQNIELVHAHYGSVVALTGYFVSCKLAPLVISYCGDDLLGTPIKGVVWKVRSWVTIKISKLVSLFTHGIIVKNSHMINCLPIRTHSRVTVVPNGVDTDFFFPTPYARKFPFDLFFYAGENDNSAVKNRELAEAVIQQLAKEGHEMHLRPVWGLSPQEFREKLQNCICLLLTSLHEGSPNVVKEALACNTPVVSTSCGDVAERLNGVNKGGVFLSNAKSLATGVIDVIQSDAAFNGRQILLEQKLDQDSVSEKIVLLYKSCISNYKHCRN